MLTSHRLILVFMYAPPPTGTEWEVRVRTDTAHGEEHGSLGMRVLIAWEAFLFYYKIDVFRCKPLLFSKYILFYKVESCTLGIEVKSFKLNGNFCHHF